MKKLLNIISWVLTVGIIIVLVGVIRDDTTTMIEVKRALTYMVLLVLSDSLILKIK